MATTFYERKNNAVSTLLSQLTAGATSATLASGGGAKFPSSGTWLATIWDNTTYPANPSGDPNMEVVLVTSRSSDTLTITRAQSGTADVTHAAGSYVGLLIMDEALDQHETAINALENAIGSNGGMVNGKIVTSVASSDLTVAIKTLAGTDPSTTDPVYVRIGNTVRSITAALSVTKADATNWFGSGSTGLAALERNYYVYLLWNTTPATDTVTLGFALNPNGLTYADFNNTSTSPLYFAFSGSDTPTSTDEMQNVGRFNAILGATATFIWTLPAVSRVYSVPKYDQISFYAEATTNQGSITTIADLTSITIDMPIVGAGQRVELTCHIPSITVDTDGATATISIRESSTQIQALLIHLDTTTGSAAHGGTVSASFIPTAGVHTYKASLAFTTGTGTAVMAATAQGFILGKLIS